MHSLFIQIPGEEQLAVKGADKNPPERFRKTLEQFPHQMLMLSCKCPYRYFSTLFGTRKILKKENIEESREEKRKEKEFGGK